MVTFNEAMLSNDRTLVIRVGDFTSENIKSANFKYGYITGDDFTPGGTYAGTASILFTSIVESFKKLDVVYPEIGLLVGSKVEWVKMGKYYIDDIKIDRNANTTEIELMDEMFKLNGSFKTDLKYPAQIRDVILEIATKTGVTLASDDFGTTAIQQHVDEPTGDKLTYRDVLSQASQLLGFSCFFNRNGELEVRGLTESGITITADNYFLHGLEKSEVEYQIAGITCEVANDEKLTVGLQTGRSLEIENPLATQDTLNLLYYALKDIVYYPYDLSYQGHLKLDVGQWVTIKTNKNETFKVPVLYQSFSFSGGLTSTISADSVAGSDTQYTYGSFVTKKIDQKSTRIQAEVQQQLKYADQEFKKASNEMLQQSLEYQNSVRNELNTTKAELETQIDTAKTQAETNAKAYADEINQATAEVAEQANTAANSLKSDLAKVQTDLTTVSNTANSAKTSLQTEINQAKQAAATVAGQLDSAKTDLTKRMSSVETLADGTRTSLNELSKTVGQNGKDLASVTSRTKTVEDTLAGTKTKLEQVSTALDGATGDIVAVSRKTADLESGLNGVNSKFEKLSIGGRNLLRGTRNFDGDAWEYALNRKIPVDWRPDNFGVIRANYPWEGVAQPVKVEAGKTYTFSFDVASAAKNTPFLSLIELERQSVEVDVNVKTFTADEYFQRYHHTFTARGNGVVYPRVETSDSQVIYYRAFKVEKGNVATDYSEADEDFRQQIAEYKQTAEQNLASLEQSSQTTAGQLTSLSNTLTQTARETRESISAVEAKIPTQIGGQNLFKETRNFDGDAWNYNPQSKTIASWKHDDFTVLKASHVWEGISQLIQVQKGKTYTFSFGVASSANNDTAAIFIALNDYRTEQKATVDIASKQITVNQYWTRQSVTFTVLSDGYIAPRVERSDTNATLYLAGFKLERSSIASDWSPAYEDTMTEISSAKLDIAKTAEGLKLVANKVNSNENTLSQHTTQITAINNELSAKVAKYDYDKLTGRMNSAETTIQAQAGLITSAVSALDNATVKSASLTINTDGVVMKAGKSTTDVANAIGAYFAVNQNAINLFSDKINVKANMIVDGAITSTKIASKSINTAHLNGKIITADVIATGAITADTIKAGAVTTDKMAANSINGDRITAGTLDAAKIKAGSITASQIASGTITSYQIKAGGISAANIATGAITTNHMSTGAITADKIAANAIDVSKITGNRASFVTDAINSSTDNNLEITDEYIKISSKSSTSTFSPSIRIAPSFIQFLGSSSSGTGATLQGVGNTMLTPKLAVGNTMGTYLNDSITVNKKISTRFNGRQLDYSGGGLVLSNWEYLSDDSDNPDNDVSIEINEYNTSSKKYAYMVATTRRTAIPSKAYSIRFNSDSTIDLYVRNIYYSGVLEKKK
ncbi:carbohydrate binding domain-containing protein [uncultured Streptococcus sp.]|uniref:carbohydrate binding domain-containing protein n=1 Tax=uncultured Streptococcus sp. TaxID=83427 RepID=UPI00205F393C|nr:carbohydrate binding domain-containing protein [uncultured Streptococcus sp.]DAF29772.1 MAG TPA: Neck appendage protein [Caudoviricetes sp.]